MCVSLAIMNYMPSGEHSPTGKPWDKKQKINCEPLPQGRGSNKQSNQVKGDQPGRTDSTSCGKKFGSKTWNLESGQTRMNTLPSICSSSISPRIELRESTELPRLSPRTNQECSGMSSG